MRGSIVLINLLILVSSVYSQDDPYRLPRDIIPTNYDLDILLEADAFETYTFSGNISIYLEVVGSESVNQIVLHSKSHTIESATLSSGDVNIPLADGPYVSDALTDQVVFPTTEGLISGVGYMLTIQYKGILSPTALEGFYISDYEENGVTKYLATTQFESSAARLAFPCFDDPSFKASWNVAITYPKGFNALSNTAQVGPPEDVSVDLERVQFMKTPTMSSYLVALVVSEFTCTAGADVTPGVPTNLCSRQDTSDFRGFAIDFAPRILNVMVDYSNFNYGDSSIGKMTQASIPDFSAGAMENWGLVTYMEAALLSDGSETENLNVAMTIAHEFSHQWFGDLVTLEWWSDLFLNEGFATYFEYHATDVLYPEWDLQSQFVTGALQVALSSDQYIDVEALSSPVSTVSEAEDKFDATSYDKGASVLRMVHHMLTVDKFKAGLRAYIAQREFSNALANDLWRVLDDFADELPTDLSFFEIMQNWTYKAGYPLVMVHLGSTTDVVLTQSRYLPDGSDDTQWYIPISYTRSNDPSDVANKTTARAWLRPGSDLTIAKALDGIEWILFNVQSTGYYRVGYVNPLWERLAAALAKEDFSGIHELNRAQIVDDLLNFALTGHDTYRTAFKVLSFLKHDVSYYPWNSAITGFGILLERVHDQVIKSKLKHHILDLMDNLYQSNKFGLETSGVVAALNQVQALAFACKLGNQDCVKNTKTRFALHRSAGIATSREIQGVVLCNGLRYSDNIKSDWEFVWNKYVESATPKTGESILEALGCAKDQEVLNSLLQKAITRNSGIRRHQAFTAFKTVVTSNSEGVDVALDFLIANFEEIVSYFRQSNSLISIIELVGSRLVTHDQVIKLEALVESGNLEQNVRKAARISLRRAKVNVNTKVDYQKELAALLND